MPLLDEPYITVRMSRGTLTSIFESDADGVIDSNAVAEIANDAELEVLSWLRTLYPTITFPLTTADHQVLRGVAFEFFYVYARDRKPEYWSEKQDGDRAKRLEAAVDRIKRFAEGSQRLVEVDSTVEPALDPGGPYAVSERRRGFGRL